LRDVSLECNLQEKQRLHAFLRLLRETQGDFNDSKIGDDVMSLEGFQLHSNFKCFNLPLELGTKSRFLRCISVTTHPKTTQYCSLLALPNQTLQEVTHPGTTLIEARLTAEF